MGKLPLRTHATIEVAIFWHIYVRIYIYIFFFSFKTMIFGPETAGMWPSCWNVSSLVFARLIFCVYLGHGFCSSDGTFSFARESFFGLVRRVSRTLVKVRGGGRKWKGCTSTVALVLLLVRLLQ